ncbi:MAG: hypothetical protein H0V76_02245 [Blastocatellia bacterium]|nr:hypothetical protein [Blastocatellia bacterium]
MADTNELALRIAKLLEGEQPVGDVASIFESLEKINHRLEKLEKNAELPRLPLMPSMPLHPSQQRFDIAEAIADEIFGAQGKEKACTFEPNDKPCDHCSMCSSRGF